MIYLDELAQAKRRVTVEGSILYVTDKGRLRKSLSKGEKQVYKVEFKKGIQYVYDEKNIQIQPKKESKAKSSKKGASKLSDSSDVQAD